MTRVEFTGAELAEQADSLVHRLVIPRPIAWVSTRPPDGGDNLAPHSFFMVVSGRPPILLLSTIGWKDTARNAVASGEFVVNVSTESAIDEINRTATAYPESVSEFDQVGLTRRPSLAVGAPSVDESPAAMECRLLRWEEVGSGILLFGEVVAVTVEQSVMAPRGPDPSLLAPIARLGGAEWASLGAISARRRIPYAP